MSGVVWILVFLALIDNAFLGGDRALFLVTVAILVSINERQRGRA